MEPLEGLREHVGGGVAQHREVLVGLIRDDLDPCAVVDRRVLFDEFAVDLPRDRVATEPRADLEGNVFDCRPRRHVELCSVRKDDRHVGLRIGLAHTSSEPDEGHKFVRSPAPDDEFGNDASRVLAIITANGDKGRPTQPWKHTKEPATIAAT